MSSMWNSTYYLGKFIGKYKIVEVLGTGGMGVVYKAIHTYLKREVALKLVLPVASTETSTERFFREARVLADLKHQNIVEIYDFDFTDEGHPYYVMELLEGRSLKSILLREKLNTETVVDFVSQIADALSYAHKKGVIHRDLKPSNIFVIEKEGEKVIKILDFGIAKLISHDKETLALTGTSDFLGTPYYVAPEQVLNENLGPYTDIYSLGLIVAEMLLGKPVREDKSLGEILGNEIRKPVDLSLVEGIPENFSAAIYKATLPDIKERFQSAKDFAKALTDTSLTEISVDESIIERGSDESIIESLTEFREEKKSFNITKSVKVITFFAILFLIVVFVYFSRAKSELSQIKKIGLNYTGKSVDVPPDSIAFVGATPETLYFTGGDSIYSLSLKGKMDKVWPVEMVKKDNIVGFDGNGSIFVKKFNSLIEKFLPEKKERVLLKNMPQGEDVVFCPSNSTLVCAKGKKLLGYKILNGKALKAFKIILPFNNEEFVFKVNQKYVAALSGTMFVVYSVKDGKKIYSMKFNEIIGHPVLGLSEGGDVIAAGGWTEKIYLFDLKTQQKNIFELPGRTYHINFVGEKTLMIGKEGFFAVIRGGKVFQYKDSQSLFLDSTICTNGLAVLCGKTFQIKFLQFSEFPVEKKLALSPAEIWAMSFYKDKLFVGGREGKLYEIDLSNFKIRDVFAHNQGITSIEIADDYLITASDDRTIGVFSLPEAKLIMRSKAHSYLINYLYVKRNSKVFWSSSSDGTIKEWSLPFLEQRDVIKLNENKFSFAAFYVGQKTLLVGSWNKRLFVFKKHKEKWRVSKSILLDSLAIYKMIYFPSLSVVLGIGIYPSNLYLYDLKMNKLYYLPLLDNCSWLVRLSSNSCVVFGNGLLFHFTFKRLPDGFYYQKESAINTNLCYQVAAAKSNDGLMASGNFSGNVFFFDVKKVKFLKEESGSAFPVK